MGREEAHHFRPKLWIASAGVIQVRLARGWFLQKDFVENRPEAPMPVGGLTHRAGVGIGSNLKLQHFVEEKQVGEHRAQVNRGVQVVHELRAD